MENTSPIMVKRLHQLSKINCCADCHTPFRDDNDKVVIKTWTSKSSIVPEYTRTICEQCSVEQFEDSEPNNIFGT